MTISVWVLVEILWLLAACWLCYRAGLNAGIHNTLDYLESQGVIEKAEDES